MSDSTTQRRADAREIFRTIQMLKERMVRCFEGMPRDSVARRRAPDITFPQWNAMTVLEELREATIKELAERLQVSPPSASVMVDRLVELGLVTREQRKNDRRAVRIILSREGATVLKEMETEMLKNIEGLMEKIGGDMTAQWCAVYAVIREVIEAEARAASREEEKPAV